jgi:hypothetical protein
MDELYQIPWGKPDLPQRHKVNEVHEEGSPQRHRGRGEELFREEKKRVHRRGTEEEEKSFLGKRRRGFTAEAQRKRRRAF